MIRHQYSEPVPARTLLSLGWGDGLRHDYLIYDLLKYSPADFLYLYENTSTKAQRLEFMLSQGEHFLDAPATLSQSIRTVGRERESGPQLCHMDIYDEEIEFGIIDSGTDEDCIEGHPIHMGFPTN
jgi:hypothetical protein